MVRAKVGEGPERVGRAVGWLRRIHWRVSVGMDILDGGGMKDMVSAGVGGWDVGGRVGGDGDEMKGPRKVSYSQVKNCGSSICPRELRSFEQM